MVLNTVVYDCYLAENPLCMKYVEILRIFDLVNSSSY